MTLVSVVECPRYTPYRPEDDLQSLGCILAECSPDFGPLVLYGPAGCIEVTVR